MKIENDIKLDFSDVLVRPKRTVLSSRSQVSLEREFKFPHSTSKWTGVPVMAANGYYRNTFDVMNVLSRHKMLTCLTKFYSKDCYDANLPKCPLQNYNGIVSTGISDADFVKLCEIIDWKKLSHLLKINQF